MPKQPIYLNTPIAPEQIQSLQVGDIIYLSGIICTGRDQVHKRIVEFVDAKIDLPQEFMLVKQSAVYHMGPIIKEISPHQYQIISGGPTTSERMTPYQAKVCKSLNLACVIGKEGMRGIDWGALSAVYLQYPGGAGAIASKFIENVESVVWLDLGLPEAAWFLRVKNFGPLVVAIDSNNKSLYSN